VGKPNEARLALIAVTGIAHGPGSPCPDRRNRLERLRPGLVLVHGRMMNSQHERSLGSAHETLTRPGTAPCRAHMEMQAGEYCKTASFALLATPDPRPAPFPSRAGLRTGMDDMGAARDARIRRDHERRFGDMISYQNEGKYSTAESRKAGRS